MPHTALKGVILYLPYITVSSEVHKGYFIEEHLGDLRISFAQIVLQSFPNLYVCNIKI